MLCWFVNIFTMAMLSLIYIVLKISFLGLLQVLSFKYVTSIMILLTLDNTQTTSTLIRMDCLVLFPEIIFIILENKILEIVSLRLKSFWQLNFNFFIK